MKYSFVNILFLCVWVFFCMYFLCTYIVHTEARNSRSPGTGVLGCYEPLCGCWDLNLGSLQEKPVLVTTKLSLKPLSKDPFVEYIESSYNQ